MPGPIYTAPAMKMIPASDMPGYQPTSINWNPTTIAYQLSNSGSSSAPAYFCPSLFTPKTDRGSKQSKQFLSQTPSHTRVTGSEFASQLGSIPPIVREFWVKLARSRQETRRGIKRKGYDGKNAVIESNPAKRICLPLRPKSWPKKAVGNSVISLAIRTRAPYKEGPANDTGGMFEGLAIRTKEDTIMNEG